MKNQTWTFKKFEFRMLDKSCEEPQIDSLIKTVLGEHPPDLSFYSENEKAKIEELKKNLENNFKLRLGVYLGDMLVAYFNSYQTDSSNLHMALSAVHPEHQRRGIYGEYLSKILQLSAEMGFQSVDSFHRATNNPVLIAKLKAGFFISGIRLLDTMGTLVHLTYLHNPKRRELAMNRCGMTRPSREMRKLFF